MQELNYDVNQLVVKKVNRLSIIPVSNDVAKILLDEIKRNY